MRFSCPLPVDDSGEDGFLSIEGITQMPLPIWAGGNSARAIRRTKQHGTHRGISEYGSTA